MQTLRHTVVSLLSGILLSGLCGAPASAQRNPVVLNARVDLNWLDAHHVWYQRQSAPDRTQYILVDARSGERQPLFDHAEMAVRLGEQLGRDINPNRLPIDHLEIEDDVIRMLVRGADSLLVADRNTLALREAGPGDLKAVGATLVSNPGSSRSGGGESALLVHNATDHPVRMVWLDTSGNRRPYDLIQPGTTHRQHTYAGHSWLFIAEGGDSLGGVRAGRQTTVVHLGDPGGPSPVAAQDADTARSEPARRRPPGISPDGRWNVLIRDHIVVLRDERTGETRTLANDGSAENAYVPRIYWSPDSSRVIVMRTRQGSDRRVYYVEAAPRDQLQPKLHSYAYRKPGDEIPQTFPHLFDPESGREIELDRALFDNPWAINNLRWSDDGELFTFVYNQRGHQVVRVIAIDRETGEVRALINEEPETFFDYSNKLYRYDVPPSQHAAAGEIIWMSERSGWNHLYLHDAKTGDLINPITQGEWVVRGVDRVDPDACRIWFRAMGIHPDQDPYHIHFARVNFDGSNLTILTDGDGTHEIEPSPDGGYLVVRYSRVDLPPVTELRDAETGTLITEFERAELIPPANNPAWRLPTRFTTKGRDGETDIHGMIHWPRDYDPDAVYPVIEYIYAGPHGFHVPKSFRTGYGHRDEFNDLGFIVVQIDGMGTNWRSKAFHDHAWKNIKDGGFPDRKIWLRAAAAEHPSFDLSRVGIYGGSAGGQNAMRALIDHHDLYKVAVADCGCHDNRIDKIWWNEAWMGWPVDESYEESSNVVHAHRMEGRLLLIVGEKDENVDPASTIQVVDALIRANKDFDFLLIPGAGHGAAETPYGRRIRRDFFVRHLLNAPSTVTAE